MTERKKDGPRIDLGTYATIAFTALVAFAIEAELDTWSFMTFICGWLWAMVMAVLLRIALRHA